MRKLFWLMLAAIFMVVGAGCGEKFSMNTKVSSAATVTAEDCSCDCEVIRRIGTPME